MNTGGAFAMAFVGCVLTSLIIISLVTDHWEDYDYDSNNATNPVSVGLWRFCRVNGCVHFFDRYTTAALQTVRAFLFMSMLMALMASLFSIRKACGKPDSKYLVLVPFVTIPLFMFIGMIIYTAMDIEDNFFAAEVNEEIAKVAARFWGYSFIIGWITFILSLIAFILAFVLERPPKQVDGA